MRWPSAVRPGRSRARAPVAMMMLGAVSVRVWSPVVTVSSVALVSVPLPSTTLTLFFFISPLTPPLSCAATLRLRSVILARSKPTPVADRP